MSYLNKIGLDVCARKEVADLKYHCQFYCEKKNDQYVLQVFVKNSESETNFTAIIYDSLVKIKITPSDYYEFGYCLSVTFMTKKSAHPVEKLKFDGILLDHAIKIKEYLLLWV